MRRIFVPRVIPVVVAMAFSGGAAASAFQLLEQNASGIGVAYAGSAAIAEDASTVFFNPAGMTKLRDRELSAGLAMVRPSFDFTNKGSFIAPATGTGTGDAGDWAAIPNGYLSWAVSKDLYVGLGFSAPFGLKTEYDPNWVGRFQSISFEIKTYNINPSIAYRVNDQVSLGFGVNWQRMDAEYVRMAAVAHPAVPALSPLVQSTKVVLDANDDSWGWNAGVLFDVSPSTRVGLSYRSKVKHTLEGTLESNRQAVSPNVDAKAAVDLPDTLILSAVQKIDEKWTMLGDISWTGWGSVDQVDIIRTSGAAKGSTAQILETRFRDTWRVAFGGIYHLNNTTDLKFGVAYDQTPVKSASLRLVSLPDNDRIWLSAGAQWKLSREARLDVGASYLLVRDTKIDNNQLLAGRGRVTGSYDSSVLILGAQYSLAF